MTRIAFTADLHVDEYGSRINPETGLNARLEDYLATTRFVATRAREEGAAGLVVAGDFTERRYASAGLATRIREALSDGPRQQVYVRGNHDGERAGRSIVNDLADGALRRAVSDKPATVFVGDVAVCCIPYVDRHWFRAQDGAAGIPESEVIAALGETFLTMARNAYIDAERAKARSAVLVCHQTLSGGRMSDTQQAFLGDLSLVIDTTALAAIGFEAVVAGHLHGHQVLVEGNRPVLYAGSIERVDFGEEHQRKGFIVADVEPGRFAWQFVETPARQYVTITGGSDPDPELVRGAIVRGVDLDPGYDLLALRAELEAQGAFEIRELVHRKADAPAIVGGLPEGLTAQQTLDAFFEADPDREALVERGRGILAEVAA